MTRVPTGRLVPTADGFDLSVTRTFQAPIDDVWASVTESERTALWFGPWEGEAGAGKTIRVQMAFEEQTPWFDLTIEACEPQRRLAVSSVDESGGWKLELLLAEQDGGVEFTLIQHLDSVKGIGEIGPGWEYYVDMLVASRDGLARPDFGDYYPAQQAYFEGLAN